MPFITRGSRRGRVAAITSLGLLALAPAAQAADAADAPIACVPTPKLSQPFMQFGDLAAYTLAPGGDFESTPSTWKLSEGAGIIAGNQPYDIGAAGSSSLSLPSGGSARSTPICVDETYTSFRMFARNTGRLGSALKVVVIYVNPDGSARQVETDDDTPTAIRTAEYYKASASAWAPTASMKIDPTLNVGGALVAFKLKARDGGDWNIDDVYVDPYARR